ncbi:beta-toxin Im-2-like [Centruroides sculpturatus]|uniref:beta-toxin Im-2-like n=1 Tax=Centruroides sculpturatus TaxID=218467 RepID=UPI000C6D998F|nr:beta-toxin Im-2-like [Centruroides sculpturatus]
MKSFLLFICCLMVIDVVVESKDGYPMDNKGCKVWCVINSKSCDNTCKAMKGKSGYCYFLGLACWCEGLPSNAKVWEKATNKCGKK